MSTIEARCIELRSAISFYRNRALELEDILLELENQLQQLNLAATPAIAGEPDPNDEWTLEPPYNNPDPADNDPLDDAYAVSMREDLIRKYCGYARCNHPRPDRTRSGKAKRIAKLKKERRYFSF